MKSVLYIIAYLILILLICVGERILAKELSGPEKSNNSIETISKYNNRHLQHKYNTALAEKEN